MKMHFPLLLLVGFLGTTFCAFGQSDNVRSYLDNGYTLQQAGDDPFAILYFDEVIVQEPYHSEALYARAYSQFRLGKYELALQDLDRLLEQTVPTIEAHYLRARVHAKLQHWGEVIIDCLEVLAVAPTMKAYTLRGEAYLEMHEYAEAFADLDYVLRYEPGNYTALHLRGKACSMLRQYDDALHFLNRAVAANDQYPAIYNERALVYLQLDRHQDAMADFSTSLRLMPDSRIFSKRAMAAMQQAETSEEALVDALRARRLDPDNVDAWYCLAMIKYWEGNPDRAINFVDAAIVLDPEVADFYLLKAQAHRQKGDYLEAVDNFDTATALDKTLLLTVSEERDYCFEQHRKMDEIVLFGNSVEAVTETELNSSEDFQQDVFYKEITPKPKRETETFTVDIFARLPE